MSKEAYEQYLRLWLELDQLWAEGKGESEEAESLRDRMDAPWFEMTAKEIEEFHEEMKRRERGEDGLV